MGSIDTIVLIFFDQALGRDSRISLCAQVVLSDFSWPIWPVFFCDNDHLSWMLDFCAQFDCSRGLGRWFVSSGDKQICISLQVAPTEKDIVVDASNWVGKALELTLIDHDVLVHIASKVLGPCGGIGCDVKSHVVDHDDDQVDVALNAPVRFTLILQHAHTVSEDVLDWPVLNDIEWIV